MPYDDEDERIRQLEEEAHGSVGRTGQVTPEEQVALATELNSPLSPGEYDAAYRQNVWDDTDPQQPMGGEALATQGMMDELSPSMTPPAPDAPGNYVYDHASQGYINDPNDPYQDPNSMDLGRGEAFSDMVGNQFYSPHNGPQEGRAMPLPAGIQGPDFEQYMSQAETQPGPSTHAMGGLRTGSPERQRSQDMLAALRELNAAHKPGVSVSVGTPIIHKKPGVDVEIGTPEILPPEEDPMTVPDEEDPRFNRR